MNLGKPVPTLRASGFGLELEVPDGAKVWLRGPNGAGKTTILRALAGLETHVDVAPRINGSDPTTWPARRLREHVAYVPQDARERLVGLTVAGEARLRGLERGDDREVATLSTGEASRVALDLLDAPVWLLDEPATHLDAAGRDHLRQRVANHEGTVLFTDHTGHLGDLATHTIHMGEAADAPLATPEPRPGSDLQCKAQQAQSGVQLPAVAMGTGIHIVRGPNGSGKTSLLRILAGLDGEATWRGQPIRPGTHTAMVGPDPFASLIADRVGDLVDASPLVHEALLDRHPWTLSSGEAQRVVVARALARDVPILLLDEPEAHLDAAGLAVLFDVLAARDGCTVIASHDARLPASLNLEAP